MNNELFDLKNRVVVLTGATGVLCSAMAQYLAEQGANVVLLGRSAEKLAPVLQKAQAANPQCMAAVCDVLDADSLRKANAEILEKFGRVDVLINGAGGNLPGAVVGPESSFFDLDYSAWRSVLDLNLGGTLLPTLVFGKIFEQQKKGVILNFSSMTAKAAITRVFGYANAKAAIENFTAWLAVEFAKKIAPEVRVNAVAPGFFISEQNRALLTNPDGSLTARGGAVIAKTPFGRFGEPGDLFGAVHFLISDAAAFVTGVSLCVDGGFSSYSGV